MKFRCTIVVERELTDQRAHENYKTLDPYTIAQAMTREAEQLGAEHGDRTVKIIGVTVVPLHG